LRNKRLERRRVQGRNWRIEKTKKTSKKN